MDSVRKYYSLNPVQMDYEVELLPFQMLLEPKTAPDGRITLGGPDYFREQTEKSLLSCLHLCQSHLKAPSVSINAALTVAGVSVSDATLKSGFQGADPTQPDITWCK